MSDLLDIAVRSFIEEEYGRSTLVGRAYDLSNPSSKEELVERLRRNYLGVLKHINRTLAQVPAPDTDGD